MPMSLMELIDSAWDDFERGLDSRRSITGAFQPSAGGGMFSRFFPPCFIYIFNPHLNHHLRGLEWGHACTIYISGPYSTGDIDYGR